MIELRTEKQREEKRLRVSTEQATSTCTLTTSWCLLEKELPRPVVITPCLPTRFQVSTVVCVHNDV